MELNGVILKKFAVMDDEIARYERVDVAVLLSPSPLEFYAFYLQMTARLSAIPELDLVDLSRADSVLAFEVLCGRRLHVGDADAAAEFASLAARQYEDDLAHAAAYCAA